MSPQTTPQFFAKSQAAWDFAVLSLDDVLAAYPDLAKATAIHFWSGDEPDCPLAKATSIPPGAHWITVHGGNGAGKGTAVLVQPVEPGSKTVHIIGGAGGKLNYLKLTGLKSPEHYAQEAAGRARDRREEAKAQKAKDKELGVHDQKQEARTDVKVKKNAAEHAFVKTVADAMGWAPDALAFDDAAHAGMSDAAIDKARTGHQRDLLKRAKEAVGLQRKRLLIDADARKEAFSGDIPLHTDDTTKLSVSDIDPVKVSAGLGFDPAYKERAEAAGLTNEDTASEVQGVIDVSQIDAPPVPAEAVAAKAAKIAGKAETSAKIKAELEAANVDKPDLPARIVDVQQAVALLQAEKHLKAVTASAKDANKKIDKDVEPKAYVLQVGDVSPADIEQEVHDALRTEKARTFLKAAADGGADTLDHHLAAGAYNAINALAMAAGGTSMVDRSVVDVLGTAAASQILARKLRQNMTGKQTDDLADGMGKFHLQHQEELADKTLAEVAELHEQAAQFDLGGADNADDLLVKSELNKKRVKALSDAQQALGRSLGELEANATMVFALREPSRDSVQVSLGATSPVTAIKQLRALGLEKGDYKMEKGAGNTFVTITAAGMDRLASDGDPEGVARVRRNLAIMKGSEDEDNWLPQGFSNRADLALNLPAGVALSLSQPFEPGTDLAASLRNYIGSRTADGDRAADILSDIQSAPFFDKVGNDRAADYRAALDAVAPNKGPGGKQMQRAEDMEPAFNKFADDFVQAKWGGERSTLNRQTFEADDIAQDALHRALSAEPAGTAAYKPIGDLTDGDRRALRNFFSANVAKESPEHAALREQYAKHAEDEPVKTQTDMFGDEVENPQWSAWNAAKSELAENIRSTGLSWPDYAHTMRGQANAYAAMQDVVRSKVSAGFAEHYNKLNPGSALKVGRTVIRGNLNHLDAVDPAAREVRIKTERQLIDSLRERSGGKYTSGSVGDKLDAAKEQKAAFEQSQMGFFSAAEMAPPGSTTGPTALAADERHTIGHAAEQKIAAMMDVVGHNFVPGQPVKLFNASMSGPDGIKRQRFVKFALANKRVIAGLGVGSGKTGLGLGMFSHLHSEGKIKKGVFVVPSIVQGQFGAEALRFLKPGQFNWHCQPGASHDERMASYKDPDTHFHVVTHQSFRDDVLKIAAKHEGTTPDDVAQKLDAMDAPGRATYIKAAMGKEGISFDFAMADEGHGLLNREGKDNSRMSNAVQGVTDNAEYYMHASGDPVKNDASEAFDLLHKMDTGRYNDRAAFMRRYGGDTVYAKDGLRRELARHAFLASIKPDVQVKREQRNVELSPAQKASMDALDRHVASARIAKMQGKVDIPALQALSPNSFEGADPAQHEAIAGKLTKALGVIHESAVNRVINAHPDSGKLHDLSGYAGERKGKPGVVFARSLDAVNQIKARLEAEGHRVSLITGKDSSKEKAAKIRGFNPDSGERTSDVVICSDAGAVGANLQSGSWLYQYDTPQTAMVHAQRKGRIERVGQKNAIELADAVANHASERKGRARLAKKYALRELVTDPLDGLDDTGLASFLHHQEVNDAQSSMF